MRAQDLRLENYLEQGKIIELRRNVCRIEYKSDKIRTALISYTDLKPIPLTEEILLECGFIPCSILENHFNIKGMCIFKLNEMFLCDKNGVIINSLNQLQNLYFAITGVELEINL